ncbi:MAG: YbgC/FadM family acyl-CoA thioesterase [Elusimicrobia bacterium]|nr:YbgC/FadM family acyl-CoA thioesterase [Elusimicrobiota bacterium]
MSKTVLIVDDDQTLVVPLKEGLESSGYSVHCAADGGQGVLKAQQVRPDAIILDFYMPGGDGLGAYEALRSDPLTRRTPILFSSAVPMDELRQRVKDDSQTFFLKKPVGLSQILGVLRPLLSSPKTDSPAEFGTAIVKEALSRAAPRFHEFKVRVAYADTDKMGIIYYANYFKYFETGRTELLRSLGVRYRDLEIQRKLFIPVVETGCRYVAPSRYDDLLVVRTWISDIGKASVRFENEIYDEDLGGAKVATGFSRHAVVNDLFRNVKVPDDLRRLLAPYIRPGARDAIGRIRTGAQRIHV